MFIAKHMIRYPPFVTHGVNISDTKKDRFSKKLRNVNTSMINEIVGLKEEVRYPVGCESEISGN